MPLFEGKVALVTGGGSGIGQATCHLYARQGAKVIVSDIDETGADETVQTVQEMGGDATCIRADVSKPGDCQAMVNATVDRYGRLDVAFNNAGIGGEANPTADYSVEGWQKVIAINLSGVFYCMKYEIPAMLRSGGGAIVNMASILGQVGFENSPAYVSAKHGVLGESGEVAELVIWLSSDKASYVSGSYYPIDGGYLAH